MIPRSMVLKHSNGVPLVSVFESPISGDRTARMALGRYLKCFVISVQEGGALL